MKKKGILAILLAAALSIGTFCGFAVDFQVNTVSAKANKNTKTYGTPWINSSVAGMVTDKIPRPKPQDDFYLYKNYNRILSTKMRPGYIREGTFGDVGDIVERRIQSLMTDSGYTDAGAKLVQEYYQMFLDWNSRNEAARPYFESHMSPIEEISDIESLSAYLSSEEAFDNGVTLAEILVSPDLTDPRYYSVDVGSASLSLGDSAEYKKLTAYGKRQKTAVIEEAKYVLEYAGYSEAEASAIIDDAFSFEAKMAEFIMSTEEQSDKDAMKKINNPCSKEVLGGYAGAFPLISMLDNLGYGSSLRYNLEEPKWLEKVSMLYTDSNVGQMKNYLLFTYARNSLGMLDETAYRREQKILREKNGLTFSRDDTYYAYIDTKSALWNFVDQMYVKKYCSPKMKEDVRSLMQDAVLQYKRLLRRETWLSKKTRKKAITKLNNIVLCPVYPDVWDDWSAVEFDSRADGGSYQAAIASIQTAKRKMEIRKINTMVDRKVWGQSCTDVNASYWPNQNRILVYAGILNGKLYNESMSEEEKMGTIGVIIGHEISHGFDTRGSQFDEVGAFKNWWTKADKKAFLKKTKKLVAYYDSIRPFKNGQPYSGTIVQGEAIADMGGMKCMLSIAESKKTFNYKEFFAAYGQTWFAKWQEEAMENILSQDPHPIEYLRINTVLPQFDRFYKTYGIKPGDGMYISPADRVAIW